jgi:peptide/nickel transport system substrate-binding protein
LRFSLKLLSPPYLQGVMQRSGQYIVQALKEVGIGVSIEVPDVPSYMRRVYRERDFDLNLYNAAFVVDACISTVQWYTTAAFRSGGAFRNHSGLQDPKVDAAADLGCTALDTKDRAAALAEFQQLTSTSLSVLNLAQEDRVNVYRIQLKNVGANSSLWYNSSWADIWLDR